MLLLAGCTEDNTITSFSTLYNFPSPCPEGYAIKDINRNSFTCVATADLNIEAGTYTGVAPIYIDDNNKIYLNPEASDWNGLFDGYEATAFVLASIFNSAFDGDFNVNNVARLLQDASCDENANCVITGTVNGYVTSIVFNNSFDADFNQNNVTRLLQDSSCDNNSDCTITGTISGFVTEDVFNAAWPVADGNFDKTGDWTGTFDTHEGTYYLDYTNFTNTPYIPTEADIDANALGIINGLDLNNSLAYLQSVDLNAYVTWTGFASAGDGNYLKIGTYIPSTAAWDANFALRGAFDSNAVLDSRYVLISDSNNAGRLDYAVIANHPYIPTEQAIDGNVNDIFASGMPITDGNLSVPNVWSAIDGNKSSDGGFYYAGASLTLGDGNIFHVNDTNLALTFYKQADANTIFVKISDSNNSGRLNYLVIKDFNGHVEQLIPTVDLNAYMTESTFDSNFLESTFGSADFNKYYLNTDTNYQTAGYDFTNYWSKAEFNTDQNVATTDDVNFSNVYSQNDVNALGSVDIEGTYHGKGLNILQATSNINLQTSQSVNIGDVDFLNYGSYIQITSGNNQIDIGDPNVNTTGTNFIVDVTNQKMYAQNADLTVYYDLFVNGGQIGTTTYPDLISIGDIAPYSTKGINIDFGSPAYLIMTVSGAGSGAPQLISNDGVIDIGDGAAVNGKLNILSSAGYKSFQAGGAYSTIAVGFGPTQLAYNVFGANTTTHGLTGVGSVLLETDLEVDRDLFVDNNLFVDGNVTINENVTIGGTTTGTGTATFAGDWEGAGTGIRLSSAASKARIDGGAAEPLEIRSGTGYLGIGGTTNGNDPVEIPVTTMLGGDFYGAGLGIRVVNTAIGGGASAPLDITSGTTYIGIGGSNQANYNNELYGTNYFDGKVLFNSDVNAPNLQANSGVYAGSIFNGNYISATAEDGSSSGVIRTGSGYAAAIISGVGYIGYNKISGGNAPHEFDGDVWVEDDLTVFESATIGDNASLDSHTIVGNVSFKVGSNLNVVNTSEQTIFDVDSLGNTDLNKAYVDLDLNVGRNFNAGTYGEDVNFSFHQLTGVIWVGGSYSNQPLYFWGFDLGGGDFSCSNICDYAETQVHFNYLGTPSTCQYIVGDGSALGVNVADQVPKAVSCIT